MNDNETIRELLRIFVHGNDAERDAARTEFYRRDEDAVDPLTDEFYAGVDEATGVAILEIISAIGGPDALRLLKYACYFGDKEAWRDAGARGLADNGISE
jgi:hypothetical protein